MYQISITPGQPIERHPKPVAGLDGEAWEIFCDAYDAAVVRPYRRAKLLIAISFLALLLFVMGTLTLTSETFEPTGRVFLVAPSVFMGIALTATVYMFSVYPRVSHELQALCESTQTPNVIIRYCHNDARHDLSEHVIQFMTRGEQQKTSLDIETAVPLDATDNSESSSSWHTPLLAPFRYRNDAHHQQ